MKNRSSGFAVEYILYSLVVLGIGLFVAKPRILDGESRRADKSQKATEAVIATTDKKSAVAAASVTKVGEVLAATPDSLEKTFMTRELALALSGMSAPDPQALLDAERRKSAVLTGQLEVTTKLYTQAFTENAKNSAAATRAEADARAANQELQRVAAEHLGAERTKSILMVVAIVAVLLWLYVKATHLSPAAVAELSTDINSGTPAAQALDSVTNRLTQLMARVIKARK